MAYWPRLTRRDTAHLNPITLNPYLFEDGNPISGLDPTGQADFVELLSTIGDMATELGETAVSVYRAYRAVDAVEKAFTLVGAVVSGIENVTTGPQSLAPFYRFVIGFVGGAIQGAIALEAQRWRQASALPL